MNPDLNSFLQAWTGGCDVSAEERQRLLERLKSDAAFRVECAEEVQLLGLVKTVQTPTPRWLDLHDALSLNTELNEPVPGDLARRVAEQIGHKQAAHQQPVRRWLARRPLTAAAAGLMIGLLGASLVFAYVAPSLGKATTLLQESFESGPSPLVAGVPQEVGRWSGDFTEVVSEQEGVKPETGKKMLRFLRADYEGKVKPEGSYISEVYQLIDLRPYQREFADGGAVVQLSAAFNAFAFPVEEAFGCSVSLHAMDAEMALSGVTQMSDMFLTDCLAMARNNRMKVDRHPATWQRLSAELRLPPGAEYLLIRIGLEHSNKTQRRVNFDGHYLDDVRLTLARRAALP